MLDKYITIQNEEIEAAQNMNSGTWYIKSLKANSIKELERKIQEANIMLNKYNVKKEKSTSASLKKEKKPMVKGLK
jgi:hypothetical protein